MIYRQRTFAAKLALLLLIAPIFLFMIADDASAQGDFDVSLYLHGLTFTLNTEPSTITETPPLPMTPGSELNYTMNYPLTRDVTLTGGIEGSQMVMVLNLEGSTLISTSQPVLKVRVYSQVPGHSAVQIAGADFEGVEMAEDDLLVPFISSSGIEIESGAVIMLVIAMEGTPSTPNRFSFLYFDPVNGESSRLSFKTKPIPDDGVGLELLNSKGTELTSVIPYGPEEARTVVFVCSVEDIFGAYDVGTIGLLVRSASESILLNTSTDEPSPGDGAALTYFNYTYVMPEGTPTGTYTVIVTATSNTGYQASVVGELIVESGLFLALTSDRSEVDAGEVAVFTLEVLNGGDAIDRVTFSGSSDQGWTVEPPSALEIAGGETANVDFRVYVPIRSAVGAESEITLLADSRNAGKSYSQTGTVYVKAAATFGLELQSPSARYIFAGDAAVFDVSVLNLMDKTRTFEMTCEDLPPGWAASYSGANGSISGSLFVFDIGPSGEVPVQMTYEPPASETDGLVDISTYVRPKGETERRYVYLAVTVVDPDGEPVTLVDGTDTKTASRSGTSFPISYNKVFFSLELYNPTLAPSTMDLTVQPPVEWSVEYDYGSLELLPGELSTWNLSITAKKGALWNNGQAYVTAVEADAGAQGTFTKDLKVVLPKIDSLEFVPEVFTIDAKEGETVPFNITFRNRGNTEGEVTLTLSTPPELTVTMDPPFSDSFAPGEEFISRGQVKVGNVDGSGVLTFTIEYTFNDKSYNGDISVAVTEKTQPRDFNWTWVAIGIIAALMIIAVAVFLYFKMFRGRGPSQRDMPKEQPRPVVRVEAAPQPVQQRSAPPPPVRTETDEEADQAMASILGDDATIEEASVAERVEAVEATELE